jgi:hypothetical protein
MRRRRLSAFAKAVDIETIVTSAIPAACPSSRSWRLSSESMWPSKVGIENSHELARPKPARLAGPPKR